MSHPLQISLPIQDITTSLHFLFDGSCFCSCAPQQKPVLNIPPPPHTHNCPVFFHSSLHGALSANKLVLCPNCTHHIFNRPDFYHLLSPVLGSRLLHQH